MSQADDPHIAVEPDVPPPAGGTEERPTRFRWVICALLFFATTVNYLDREVIGLLKETLKADLGWTDKDYAHVTFAFSIAYMIGLMAVGRVVDLLGARRGFSIAATLWSLAAMVHALMSSVMGFASARFALGITEAANFPAAIKATAEWFPKRERALATGIFNAGSNIGIIIAALTVPFIAHYLTWRDAFLLTGIPGLIFAIVWWIYYRPPQNHPRVNAAELALIESDPVDPPMRVRWVNLIPHRQTWAFAVGKFLTDPVWWFFLFWLPGYFQEVHKVKLTHLALPMIVIFIAADIGSIGGGWISSSLIRRGWSINAGRKTAMLICALSVTPMIFASWISVELGMWGVVGVVALAAAAHQGWSANLYTLVSDTFPRSSVSSVVGFGATFGMLSSSASQLGIGEVLEALNKNYVPLFAIGGVMYVIALVFIHLLTPRLNPADLKLDADAQVG